MHNLVSKLLFVLSLYCLLLTSCDYSQSIIKGNNDYKEEHRPVLGFNKVELNGNFKITLKQGPRNHLVLKGSSNLLDYVMSEVIDSTLHVSVVENINLDHFNKVEVHIDFKKLNFIQMKGGTKLETIGVWSFDHLDIKAIGSSNLHFNLLGNSLSGSFPGATSIELEGSVKTVSMSCPGVINLEAYDLESESFILDMSGAGMAEINVSQNLKVSIEGAGKVEYKGNPPVVKSNIGGIGKLVNVSE